MLYKGTFGFFNLLNDHTYLIKNFGSGAHKMFRDPVWGAFLFLFGLISLKLILSLEVLFKEFVML